MKRSWLIAGVAALALTSLGYWLGATREAARTHQEAYASWSREIASHHLSMQFLLTMLKKSCAAELTPQLEGELASQVNTVYRALVQHGALNVTDAPRLIKPTLGAVAHFRARHSHQETVAQAEWVVAHLNGS